MSCAQCGKVFFSGDSQKISGVGCSGVENGGG